MTSRRCSISRGSSRASVESDVASSGSSSRPRRSSRELVGGLEDKRVELARLMDRFPQELQVHLEPSDISEVTSKRVLSKNAEAQKLLRAKFEENRGRLSGSTHLTADIKLPELTAERFVDLYPLLPYQIDLIIQVVSGLRTQGGASKHVGGANRTIIKLAQQLLINPAVNLADRPLGELARIDQIYDLVESNIDSEVRGKIAAIAREVPHSAGGSRSVRPSACCSSSRAFIEQRRKHRCSPSPFHRRETHSFLPSRKRSKHS